MVKTDLDQPTHVQCAILRPDVSGQLPIGSFGRWRHATVHEKCAQDWEKKISASAKVNPAGDPRPGFAEFDSTKANERCG